MDWWPKEIRIPESAQTTELESDRSKDDACRKFRGGVVSPDNPVEIETVSISKVASFGKNFAKGLLEETVIKQRCSMTEIDNIFTMNATGFDAYFGEVRAVGQDRYGTEGKLYIVNPKRVVHFKSMNGIFTKCYIQMWDKDLKSLGYIFCINPAGIRVSDKTHYISLRIGIEDSVAGTSYTDKIMLSFDPITEWEEPYYEEKSVSLDLYSLPDGTCDEVRDGKLIKRVGKSIIDGSATLSEYDVYINPDFWKIRAIYHSVSKMNLGSDWTEPNFYCDRLMRGTIGQYITKLANPDGSERICASSTSGCVFLLLKKSRFNTMDQASAYFEANPITYYYPLKEPVITDITDLIIPTKAPYTIVSHDSPIETEIEYEILTKTDYAADIIDIKKRLAALESAALD